jgi:hypothetical protein
MTYGRNRGRTPRSRSWGPWDAALWLVLLGILLVLAPALARAQSADSLVLRWTAPADPGTGAVQRYDMRVSTVPMTATEFARAGSIATPQPAAPGSAERVVVRGLAAGHSYWFAMRSADAAGNWSALSNVVRWDFGTDGPRNADSARTPGWSLAAAYPNPAHLGEVMHLPVAVPAAAADARLEIVDAANQVVRRFELRAGATSTTRVDWDGANDHGARCAPGVYRAWLVAGDTRQYVRIARVP